MTEKKDDLSVLMRDGQTVVIGSKQIEVKPLVFRQYRKAADVIGKIAARVLDDIPEFDATKNISEQIAQLPKILAYAEISELIAICTGETLDFIEDNMTLEQMTAAVIAIVEVNQIDRIVSNFSRLAPMLKPPQK